jgi:hypothetical protein
MERSLPSRHIEQRNRWEEPVFEMSLLVLVLRRGIGNVLVSFTFLLGLFGGAGESYD